jgi:hypothetical protein
MELDVPEGTALEIQSPKSTTTEYRSALSPFNLQPNSKFYPAPSSKLSRKYLLCKISSSLPSLQ